MSSTAPVPSPDPTRPVLLCRFRESLFGLDPDAVAEIVMIPEITALPEAPPHVLGVVDVRGRIVSVHDLGLWLGQPAKSPDLNDKLLILERNDVTLALRVTDVIGVRQLPRSEQGSESGGTAPGLIRGVSRLGGEVVLILDIDHVFVRATSAADFSGAGDVLLRTAATELAEPQTYQRREEFRDRARRLAQPAKPRHTSDLVPLAVLELNGELFGVGFEGIQEFIGAPSITRVPCCPNYVLGNINLRGEILTVLDIRGRLNLSPARGEGESIIVVIQIGPLRAGIQADACHDILHVRSSQILPLPCTVAAREKGYVRGAARYSDSRMMSILDLEKLMALEEWVVHEEVGRGSVVLSPASSQVPRRET